jgi:uncharacterized protein (TIGR03000 family)
MAPAEDRSSATLVVHLPEDARLTVDGQATASTSGTRVFASPPLADGKDYCYTLRAEVTRDGETQTVTRQVVIRAGDEKHITLQPSEAVVSNK